MRRQKPLENLREKRQEENWNKSIFAGPTDIMEWKETQLITLKYYELQRIEKHDRKCLSTHHLMNK